MAVSIYTLKERKAWLNELKKLPQGQQDIYYTPEYYELYEKNGDGKAMCFVFQEDDDIAIYPFLINSVNDLGYELHEEYYDIQGAYGYNGVVTSNYSMSFREVFFNKFEKFCSNYNVIAEFTRFNPILGNHQFSENFITVNFDREVVYLNIEQSYDYIWNNQYSSKNKNMIRKGQNSLFAKISNDRSALKQFKKVYLHTMEKINAANYFSFNDEYFDEFNDGMKDNSYIINTFDKHTGNIQSSMLLMIFGNYAHYHLSGRSEECKNNAAGNFMLDEAIKFSQAKGCTVFHLGGGIICNDNDPLLKFKSNFSKDRGYFYFGSKLHNEKTYYKVCKNWENKYPNKIKEYGSITLKYRC